MILNIFEGGSGYPKRWKPTDWAALLQARLTAKILQAII